MDLSASTCEIVESEEELKSIHPHSLSGNFRNGHNSSTIKLRVGERDGRSHVYPLDGELCKLIEAIDLRTSARISGPSHQTGVQKSNSKTPEGVSQATGIGISESVTLKQALRRLCISQASEMAAMKRQSKPLGVSSASEAGAIKKLYASVVVQTGSSPNEEKGNLLGVSLEPKKLVIDASEKATEPCQVSKVISSNRSDIAPSPSTGNSAKTRIKDIIAPASTEVEINPSAEGITEKKVKANARSFVLPSKTVSRSNKPSVSRRLIKAGSRNNTFAQKKGKHESTLPPDNSGRCKEVYEVGGVTKGKLGSLKESIFSSPSSTNAGMVSMQNKEKGASKTFCTPDVGNGGKQAGLKMNDGSRSKDKGECSQSSKSSIGDYSCSTSISEDSLQSGSSNNGCRPHMSKDVRWVAIHHVTVRHGSLSLKNFKLLKKLGCGDIGTVYLAELTGSDCLFALKVMDIEFLISRKKMLRAQTEREILEMLDHPFLPTLYAHFTTDNLSCLVMEYCPGGDLHVLRQKQPGRSFCEPAARFYVAEVLLALEYLHMLGVVYRDLKPENILVREDGHIMLSDFDLSLRCTVSPTLLRSSSFGRHEPSRKLSGPCPENSCIEPLCLQPTWAPVSCFTPRLISSTLRPELTTQVSQLPQLVAEPTDARSNSFVGTHEYLAPEIIRGDGHGSAVDWWTFGIFLYELLYGRTPFKGPGNDETLANVVSVSLRFPESPVVSFHARDLIRALLAKEPENRLGSNKGAAEIKQHPFFDGLNWALIRCAAPPEVPRKYDPGTPVVLPKKKEGKCLDFRMNGEDVEFELF